MISVRKLFIKFKFQSHSIILSLIPNLLVRPVDLVQKSSHILKISSNTF